MGVHATAERILVAAETLIAERGPDRVSVREITSLAGVNIAAVNYHFGTKSNLLKSLIARNADRFGARRTALLVSTEATSLEAVVRAIVQSTAELAADVDGDGRRWLRCKLQLRANPEASDLLREVFWPYTVDLLRALSSVTPHLSNEARAVRFALARDAIDAAFASDHYPPSDGHLLGISHEQLVEHLVAFLVPAFEAP